MTENIWLDNGNGLKLAVNPIGATLHALKIDYRGQAQDLIVPVSAMTEIDARRNYVNCLIGRVANRIRNARFRSNLQAYEVVRNEGTGHLHGGKTGLSLKRFSLNASSSHHAVFECLSPAGEEGYPGNLKLIVTFHLRPSSQLIIHYEAVVDAPCPIDLTHHLYFSLPSAVPCLDQHRLYINSDRRLELDASHNATGEIRPVNGDAAPRQNPLISTLSHALSTWDEGFNACYVLAAGRPLLTLTNPDNDLQVRMQTDQPCVQIYTGLSRNLYAPGAIAIEPQGYVDAVNQVHFPDPWLVPGQTYQRTYEIEILTN